jgi:protein-S-isoprenylcysteine O-methyltransferase Ste14
VRLPPQIRMLHSATCGCSHRCHFSCGSCDMKHDDTFRYLLMVGLLMLVSIGVYHRFRARTGEKLDRRQEGLFNMVALRLSAFAGLVGMAAYLVNPTNLSFSAVALPDSLRWAGVGLGCLTGFLLIWTLQSLGKNLTDTVVTRREHSLVTTGPYRWVRHPFYDCAALVALSVSLVSANALFLLTGGLVLLFLSRRTRVEEQNLLNRFGEDYCKYMDHTGRFFPRL